MTDADALRRVAKSIAVHLEHLREYRGVHYVPAGPIPHELLALGDDGELIVEAPAEGEPAPTSAPQDDPSRPVAALTSDAVAEARPQARDDGARHEQRRERPSRPQAEPPQRHERAAQRERPQHERAPQHETAAHEPPQQGRRGEQPPHQVRRASPRQAPSPRPPDDIWPHDDAWAQPSHPGRADRPRRPPSTRVPSSSERPPDARRPEPAGAATSPSAARGEARGETAKAKPASRAKASEWTAAQKLDYLKARSIGDCTRCGLCRGRTSIVFGVGNPEADVMFVGEAPGYNEDRQGIPFVGRAGERLNIWLDMLGVPRDTAYIANVLKCRPPNNRDPLPEEVARCSPFLHAQIRAIQPKVLIALGRFAGNLLTGNRELPMYKMRGRVWGYEEKKHGMKVPVVVTYHPSYVLRQSREAPPGKSDADAKVLMDLRQAVEILRTS